MNNKETFFHFCEQRSDIPLFQQAWWMDIVSGGNEWDVLLYKDKDGTILAFLPYMIVRKFFFKIILQPNLCQTNGIWMDPTLNELQQSYIHDYFVQELDHLRIDWYMQYFPNSFRWGKSFQENNFHVSWRNTYVIGDITDDNLTKKFSSAKQRHIRKAERTGFITKINSLTPNDFYQFHNHVLQQKGEQNCNKPGIEVQLCQKAIEKDHGVILSVHDQNGNLHAALFMVWDESTAYYLIPATDQNHKSSGASTWIVYQAILLAKEKGLKRFDFEGSMVPSIANSYKQYGTEVVSYAKVERISHPILKFARCLGFI